MTDHSMPNLEQMIKRIEAGLIPMNLEGDVQVIPESSFLLDRMAHYHVPGVSLAVVVSFELAWSRCYGVTEALGGSAVAEKTLFEIGSTTKLVTAIAALQMVERGLINLDDDVNDSLIGWKIPNSEHTLREKVTLRQLLNHTSGIPATSFEWEKDSAPTLVQVLRGEPPAKNMEAGVETVPGSEHAYSNLAYVVIQQLIEDVMGKSFADTIHDTVFDPLGMTASTFKAALGGHDICLPHDGQGVVHPLQMHPSAFAQGGLLSTPIDLAKLAIDLMKGASKCDSRLLRAETIQAMLQPDPELDINAYGFTDGQGLGLFLLGRGDEMKFLAPGLNLPGSTGLIIAWPARGFAVTLSTNALNGQQLQIEILNSIGAEYGFEWGLEVS